jgi:hypothetical protein
MMPPIRVIADQLYQVLEGMLYIAVKGLHDAPRREMNRIQFLDAIETLGLWLKAKR